MTRSRRTLLRLPSSPLVTLRSAYAARLLTEILAAAIITISLGLFIGLTLRWFIEQHANAVPCAQPRTRYEWRYGHKPPSWDPDVCLENPHAPR